MVGVLNKPDALNLSGNMNQFLLSSTGLISFILKKGNQTLLEQSYEPGPDLMVRIDLKEVIEGQLSYNLDAGSLFYVQPNLAETFTAVIDGTEYNFRVVRGGVANLADTATNWLKLHFLTWQPRVKPVTYYSPEWLTYYAVEECTAKLKATYPDKSTTVISLGTCVAGHATTMNLQYSVIAGKLGNTYPSYYEVWIERSGTKLSESQVYAFSNPMSEDEQWYLFENSLGGLDTFRATGTNNLNAEHEHKIAEFGDVREEYQVDTERKYVKNTGYLDEYSRHWLLDFFPSRAKYVYESTAIRKIVVTESNATYVSNELPSSYTFTWQLAEVSTYLNLVKNENDIPDNLVAPDLSSPDFILPPRLAEFPRVELTEGVLIPAFDPNNPKPTVTTYGAIHNTIKNAVVKELEEEIGDIGSGSGSGSNLEIIKSTDEETIPTDFNIYSALKSKQEDDKRVTEMEDKFIRKDKPDGTDYLLTARGGINIGDFISGLLGSGARINEKGEIEARSLQLWEFLNVPELRFNRVDVIAGETWNAIAFGLIESVDTVNQIVTLKLEDGELSGMHLNDFCRGIFHNLTGNEVASGTDSAGFKTMAGFSTTYFTPVEIIDNAHFRYELKPGTTVHPCASMKYAVYGNPTIKERQQSSYSTRTYIRFLRNVNTWEIHPDKNVSSQWGDLSDLTINGESLKEGSIYLNNVYFGGNVWNVPGLDGGLKGLDAYSVVLSSYSAVYNTKDGLTEQVDVVSGGNNVVTGSDQVVTQDFRITTKIQVTKGTELLRYSTVLGTGKYLVNAVGTGCTFTVTDGLVVVHSVTEEKAEIKLEINCEGLATYEQVFTVVRVIDGVDGTDVEWIFKRSTTEANKPSRPATSENTDDYVPKGWTDDPVGPDIDNPFEWSCKREKKNGVWGAFSDVYLWSKWGKDGKETESVYAQTKILATPSYTWSDVDNYVPSGWTSEPQGVTSEYIYEWIMQRKKVNGSWSHWSAPAIFAKWSKDGTDGTDGTDGLDGWSIFRWYKISASRPSTPTSAPPSGWSVDPPTGEGIVWATECHGRISEGGSITYKNDFIAPVQVTGQKGDDGSRGPFMTFRRKYDSTKQYTGSNTHVDAVYTEDSSGNKTYWVARPTAGIFSNKVPGTSSAYWEAFQGQFESIATGLALIEEANIAGWWFSDLVIESQNRNCIIDGNADDHPRIALGANYANRDNAPIRLYEDGNFIATNANIYGTFQTAVNGLRMVISNQYQTDNIVMQMYNAQDECLVRIGADESAGGFVGVFKNANSDPTNNYYCVMNKNGLTSTYRSSMANLPIYGNIQATPTGFTLYSNSWKKSADAAVGYVYVENGYLRVKE